MRLRDLSLPAYAFVLTMIVIIAVLLAWAVLATWVFVPEPFAKQMPTSALPAVS